MSLQIIATHAQLMSAVNSFSAAYHADYFCVRALGQSYLAVPPNMATVVPLATALQGVLSRWGAGTRKAPSQQTIHQCQTVLMNPHLHTKLNLIAAIPISTLSLIRGTIRTVTGIHNIAALAAFDSSLVDVLNALASGLFVNNTNVTYPMKALLLITGFMPAFDSQVRKGLARAGFGAHKTQMLLPRNATSADGMKITRIPFYIADCHRRNAALINDVVSASHYPALVGEVGRIFDVLLFVQSTMPTPMLVLNPANQSWYRIA